MQTFSLQNFRCSVKTLHEVKINTFSACLERGRPEDNQEGHALKKIFFFLLTFRLRPQTLNKIPYYDFLNSNLRNCKTCLKLGNKLFNFHTIGTRSWRLVLPGVFLALSEPSVLPPLAVGSNY